MRVLVQTKALTKLGRNKIRINSKPFLEFYASKCFYSLFIDHLWIIEIFMRVLLFFQENFPIYSSERKLGDY